MSACAMMLGCVTYNVIGTVKIEIFELDILHSVDFYHDSTWQFKPKNAFFSLPACKNILQKSPMLDTYLSLYESQIDSCFHEMKGKLYLEISRLLLAFYVDQ